MIKRKRRSIKKYLRLIFISLFRDLNNLIKYGLYSPRFAERIWVDPGECNYSFSKNHFTRNDSGKIIKYWPKDKIISILDMKKIKSCFDHFVHEKK